MKKQSFIKYIYKAFNISCNTDPDFSVSFLILKNNEINILFFNISIIRSNLTTRLYRKNKLTNLIL